MAVDAVVEVSGVDDVVFVGRVGVAHSYFGLGVALFGGFYLFVIEGAVAVLGGVLLDFDEVVAEVVLDGAVLFVCGQEFVQYNAVVGVDGLCHGCGGEQEGECGECNHLFH